MGEYKDIEDSIVPTKPKPFVIMAIKLVLDLKEIVKLNPGVILADFNIFLGLTEDF